MFAPDDPDHLALDQQFAERVAHDLIVIIRGAKLNMVGIAEKTVSPSPPRL